MAPVIPVLTIERASDAVPLARALVKGGLPVLEITLRTKAALEAIELAVAEVPEAVIGAGTVLKPRQFDAVRRAGARFAVSPGGTPALVTAARAAGLPFLPGIQTVLEAMALAEQGTRLAQGCCESTRRAALLSDRWCLGRNSPDLLVVAERGLRR